LNDLNAEAIKQQCSLWLAMGIFRNQSLHRSATGEQRRHHLHESVLQKAVKRAIHKSGWQGQQPLTLFGIRLPPSP
jgi:hypothetical protein